MLAGLLHTFYLFDSQPIQVFQLLGCELLLVEAIKKMHANIIYLKIHNIKKQPDFYILIFRYYFLFYVQITNYFLYIILR